MQCKPIVLSISSALQRVSFNYAWNFFFDNESLILNNIYIANNLKTAQVVFPVPLLPITNTLPFYPITFFSS